MMVQLVGHVMTAGGAEIESQGNSPKKKGRRKADPVKAKCNKPHAGKPHVRFCAGGVR